MFEAVFYEVRIINGDYAELMLLDENGQDAAQELKTVARALLPAEITEGSRLKYEMLQYSMA